MIKKYMKKLSLVILGVVIFFRNSIYSVSNESPQILYGVFEPEPEPKFDFIELFKNILTYFVIPAIFVLGLITYWKRSKQEKKKKLDVIISIIIVVIFIVTLICLYNYYNYIINY